MAVEPSASGREIVGTWLDEFGWPSVVVVYVEGASASIDRIGEDGETNTKKLAVQRRGGVVRLTEVGNEHGEFYTIDEAGRLRYWSTEHGTDQNFANLTPRKLGSVDTSLLKKVWK